MGIQDVHLPCRLRHRVIVIANIVFVVDAVVVVIVVVVVAGATYSRKGVPPAPKTTNK